MAQLQRLRASELQDWFSGQPASIRVLSLDCFDTIVWRRVGQPVDVFFAAQDSSSWRRHGIQAAHRVKAEGRARARKRLLHGVSEVTIDEIYQALLPSASGADRAECIADEMNEEVRHAYLFAPAIELIRRAKQRGLRVMVVSDTYWSRQQLATLIRRLPGGDELAHLQLHCSSEYGVSKAGGIWPHVLRAGKLQAHQLVHLGDNELADAVAPRRFGVQAAHLVHHDDDTADVLRDYASAACQIMPELRFSRPLPSLFHGQLAMWSSREATPASRIGYRSMGPVMYAFGRYLEQRLAGLRSQGRSVRVAFLMRDGHLPLRVFSALCPEVPAAALHISRFTANAAGLTSRDDVVNLLVAGVSEKHALATLKQLLFTEQEAEAIIEQAAGSGMFQQELSRQVLRDNQLRKVLARSAAFRERLYAHVRDQTGLQRGDMLVLVDLGYSGTVQTRLRQVFRSDLGVDLRGLYLIASAAQADMSDRQGLIDPSWADERMITALTAYIGLFEMMCTKAEPPAIDYTAEGRVVFGRQGTKGRQSVVAGEIQDACLAFVGHCSAGWPVNALEESLPAMAWQAAGELCRLIYFPQAEEIDCLSSFEFDFNLGTDLVLATADLEAGAREFRREGFALMMRDFTELRVSYPMEMRHLDLSLATTLLSARRFGYGIRPVDASHRRLEVSVLAANEHSHALQTFAAVATFDGYYCLNMPCSPAFDISVLLGEAVEWVQFDTARQLSITGPQVQLELKVGEQVILDGAREEAKGLFRLSPEAMVFFPRSADTHAQERMIRFVFRPVHLRSRGSALSART